jgi:Phosphopantetheine attachment site
MDAGGAATTETVRAAWADALDIDITAVPLDVSFFETGGNSFMLLLLWEQLNDLTVRDLRAADLFEHNTVLAQVRLLAGQGEQPLAALGARNRASLLDRARRAPAAGLES